MQCRCECNRINEHSHKIYDCAFASFLLRCFRFLGGGWFGSGGFCDDTSSMMLLHGLYRILCCTWISCYKLIDFEPNNSVIGTKLTKLTL